MNKPGIRSYKELMEIILKTLRDKDEEMTAQQISSYIIEHYKNNKNLSVGSLSIAKRIQGHPHVQKVGSKRGYSIYRYIE